MEYSSRGREKGQRFLYVNIPRCTSNDGGCPFSLAEVYRAIDSKVAAATLPASALSLLPVWKTMVVQPSRAADAPGGR